MRTLVPRSGSLDIAARLLDEAIGHAEAEAGTDARRLGGEEGSEGALAHLPRHAGARIGDGDQHIAAGAHFRILLRVIGVEPRLRDFDHQPAAARHRVAALMMRLSKAFCNCEASTTVRFDEPVTIVRSSVASPKVRRSRSAKWTTI
jgi:hypothetical protein